MAAKWKPDDPRIKQIATAFSEWGRHDYFLDNKIVSLIRKGDPDLTIEERKQRAFQQFIAEILNQPLPARGK